MCSTNVGKYPPGRNPPPSKKIPQGKKSPLEKNLPGKKFNPFAAELKYFSLLYGTEVTI
jgi:hypothetical protein